MSADEGFIRHKSKYVISYALMNLRRAHHMPASIRQGERPLEGRAVIVVGAGPSLRRNGGVLVDAQRKGTAIFAVNASDGPLRSLGVRPDVVFARESLVLDDQVRSSEARSWVLDLSSAPEQWNELERRRADVTGYWYLPLYPRHVHIARMLGVRPLASGTSALCAAVAHAIAWGAARIVLCGVDLAVSADGAVYHAAAPRGALRATQDGDRLKLEGDEQDHERSRRSGQPRQPDSIEADTVVAGDWGGTMRAKNVWQNQRDWLQTMAVRHDHIDTVNATESGSGILWWRAARLAEVVDHTLPRDAMTLPRGQRVDADTVERTVRQLRLHAESQRHVARAMQSTRGPHFRALIQYLSEPGKAPWPTFEGDQLLEGLSAHELISLGGMVDDAGKPDWLKQTRARLESYERWAGMALDMLGGDPERPAVNEEGA